MMKDIVVLDNCIDTGPLLDLAERVQFYDMDKHPREVQAAWKGQRTVSLFNDHNEFITDQISQILVNTMTDYKDCANRFDINWQGDAYFHKLRAKDKLDTSDIHIDRHFVYAAVLYLTKDAPEDAGTIIWKNDTAHRIENKFNRLVLYRADYLHSPMASFDTRLTMVMFFRMMNVNINAPCPNL
jgi:hypothetical protein